MYDKYPRYDVPQSNLMQRFFAQSWRAILLEIALTIVLTTAAGYAFEFFDPTGGDSAATADATASQVERAKALVSQGQYTASRQHWDALIAAEPGAASHYTWRAYANMLAGEYAAARLDYRRLLQLEPASYDGHNGICWAYGELGHFPSALGHCDIALALAGSPFERALTQENRCWLRVEMGDYSAAAADCQAALDILPACAHEVCALAHYNLGRIWLAQDQLDRAARHFHLAVYIGSAYPDMYLEIGEVYATLGYREAARSSFERFSELSAAGARG